MPSNAFKTFADVQNALQNFVSNNNIALGPPHGNFWENGSTPADQYNYFINLKIEGLPVVQKGSGKDSNIIKALSGIAPFDGSVFPQMPVNGPYLDQNTIDMISGWIDAGAGQ